MHSGDLNRCKLLQVHAVGSKSALGGPAQLFAACSIVINNLHTCTKYVLHLYQIWGCSWFMILGT